MDSSLLLAAELRPLSLDVGERDGGCWGRARGDTSGLRAGGRDVDGGGGERALEDAGLCAGDHGEGCRTRQAEGLHYYFGQDGKTDKSSNLVFSRVSRRRMRKKPGHCQPMVAQPLTYRTLYKKLSSTSELRSSIDAGAVARDVALRAARVARTLLGLSAVAADVTLSKCQSSSSQQKKDTHDARAVVAF